MELSRGLALQHKSLSINDVLQMFKLTMIISTLNCLFPLQQCLTAQIIAIQCPFLALSLTNKGLSNLCKDFHHKKKKNQFYTENDILDFSMYVSEIFLILDFFKLPVRLLME